MKYRIFLGSVLLSCSVILYANGNNELMPQPATFNATTPPQSTAMNVSRSDPAAPLLKLTPVNSAASPMAIPAPHSLNQTINQTTIAQTYNPDGLFPEPTELEKQAFQQLTKQSMPLTPRQILQLKRMLAVTQRASAAPAETTPKPVLSTQAVSLAPGATPPVIRLQQGFVTSVVFVDNTGADWPIDAYDLGNSKAFNIQWQQNSNTMMIQAISMYTYGNLAVKLHGLSTPVMLTLVPGQQVVDYRVDLRIQQSGPDAKPIHIETTSLGADSVLLDVLDGISPKDATLLQVIGGACTAWGDHDKLYLRTRLTVLSPSWLAMITSPDGMKAYKLQKTSTILVSRNGEPVELKIEGL